MRSSKRKCVKKIQYITNNDSDSENGDFQDSGSEATISDAEDTNESHGSSGEDFNDKKTINKKVIVKNKKKLTCNNKGNAKKNHSKHSLLRQIKTIDNDKLDEHIITVKDLTEQQKMLPEFLNLSESDTDSDDGKTDKCSNFQDDVGSYKSLADICNISQNSDKPDILISDKIERLSDSDLNSETEDNLKPAFSQNSTNITKKINFQNLHDHTRKLEDARKSLELYNQKVKVSEKMFDVNDLLAIGENSNENVHSLKENIKSDSECEEFEEVCDPKNNISLPKDGIQVIVDLPTGKSKDKKKLDIVMMMKRRLNRIKKEYQVYMHKVHVLSWIAHGNYVNSTLNNPIIMASALSLLPSEHSYPNGRVNIKYLEQITKWYSDIIIIKENKIDLKYNLNKPSLDLILIKQMNHKTVTSYKNKVLIYIALLRALGIKCRLILSFKVIPIKPAATELCSLSTISNQTDKNKKLNSCKDKPKNNKNLKSSNVNIEDKIPQMDGADDNLPVLRNKTNTKNKATNKKNVKKNPTEKIDLIPSTSSYWDKITENIIDSTKSNKRISHRDLKPQRLTKPKLKESNIPITLKNKNKKVKKEINDKNKVSFKKKYKLRVQLQSPQNKHESIQCNEEGKKKVEKESKYFDSADTEAVSSSSTKKRNKQLENIYSQNKDRRQKKTIKRKKNELVEKSDSSDSEFHFKTKKKINKSELKKIDRRVLSTDDEHLPNNKKKIGNDIWCEVYVEEEEQWISVDISKVQVHCMNQIYNRASHPVAYVVSWDNSSYVKDVTRRYVPHWNTITRKLRVHIDWYNIAIQPYMAPFDKCDIREDEQLDKMQLDAPLPQTILEFKNHPLYALKRHLLKFEVIYPPNAVALGFVKNEAVYARECVHICRSRETWVKEAKVVKPGEKPYKIVKARPKYDRLSGRMINDIPLEIFGPWQVDDYIPPKAENGKVPRNPYGNVELFKPCMLPEGTVHLLLPGLNKVARKLGIDCAPAMIGFDYHTGGSHPVYDGFVICEEFKDQIVDAWEQEQEEAEQRAKDKLEKRVYGNWKRLIRGLFIRERLQARYEFQSEPQNDCASTSKENKRSKCINSSNKKFKSK